MKKYKAWLGNVYEIEVKSETAQFVTKNNGVREKKITEDIAILDTFEEARDWLVQKEERNLLNVLIGAHAIGAKIEMIKSMEKPIVS